MGDRPAQADGIYRLEQRIRYSYPQPVRRLRHRLMVVPPLVHGGQVRVDHGLTVTGALVSVSETSDSFGNHVTELGAPAVAEWIEFEAWALVRRRGPGGLVDVLATTADHEQMLTPTKLTRAENELAAVASELSSVASCAMDLAERICTWTRRAMDYRHGVTGVETTAMDALAGGQGVCQDFAHVMLALCRAAGLPARYVSGHLMGEGGSHAWVEVVLTDPSGVFTDRMVAVAFDPTHERRAEYGYVTVAVGRDYDDVAPTSGSFEGIGPGALSVRKRLALADAEAS